MNRLHGADRIDVTPDVPVDWDAPSAVVEPTSLSTDWYGWGIPNGPALHIGPLPGRKTLVLYVIDGSVLTPLAYFRDEDSARLALDLLGELVTRSEA